MQFTAFIKGEFSASLLQSSEIILIRWFAAQETFINIIIIMLLYV